MLSILVTFVLLFYLRKNLLDKAMKLDANVYTPSDFCLMGKNMQFDNYNPTEIEKAIDFFYLTAEISPDILGLGEGTSESGRALKFKLMRTLAKAQRKRLYYDYGIKELLYRAQLLAKAHGIQAGGKPLKGEAVVPEIDWHDGLPLDIHDQLEDETAAIDAGLTSKKDAMMRLYAIDEEAAEKQLKEIEDEKPAITLPTMNMGGNQDDGTGGGTSGTPGFGKKKPADNLPPKGK